jgi:hypothetical protein
MADLKRQEELVVVTKTYDLILWSCNHTGKFPRNHRFVLGERIERNLSDLLEILIRAKYTRQRQELLDQANLVLEILRFQMRLAKDLQCLKVESYGFAARASDEIGKLVGCWRPAVAAFHFNQERALLRLHEELASKTNRPGAYRSFFIYEPKKRQISAAPIGIGSSIMPWSTCWN